MGRQKNICEVCHYDNSGVSVAEVTCYNPLCPKKVNKNVADAQKVLANAIELNAKLEEKYSKPPATNREGE